MKSISSSFISIILLIADTLFIVTTNDQPKLQLINVIFRHGDRTPDKIEMYPLDQNKENDFYPFGYGELTNEGKLREYELGRLLRERYQNFLGDVYLPESVFARSTAYRRAKTSLQLVLAGLYPPANIQKWHKELNWQPIPIDFSVSKDDWLMGGPECIEFIEEYFEVSKLDEVRIKIKKFDGLMKNLTEWTGKNYTRLINLYSLYHLFTAELFMNATLPNWSKKIFPNGELHDATKLEYEIYGYTETLRKLNGGKLFHKIVEEMKAAANGSIHKDHKISLYSGHETNVAATLQVLEIFQSHVPAYSSAVIFEFLKQDSDYFVKVVYYEGIPAKFVEQTLPGCGILCPFHKFLKIYRNVIPLEKELPCEMFNFETLEKLK